MRNPLIGFVFQQFNLLAYLPAWRNVELPLVYVAASSRRSAGQRAMAALDDGRVWPTGPTTGPASCPAASSSASPSPGRW